jgi:hypothetical protein
LKALEEFVNPNLLSSISTFKDYILNPRKHESGEDIDVHMIEQASAFSRLIQKYRLLPYLLPGSGYADYRDAYAKGIINTTPVWIKTPSLVVSWSEQDSAIASGGHNLGAKVTRFEVDPLAREGELKVVENGAEKKILINARDVGKINTEVLREIELSPEAKPYLHIPDDGYVARERNAVIPTLDRPERGMNKALIYVKEEENGFRVGSRVVQRCDELVDELTQMASDGTYDKLEVHFENVSPRRAKAIIKSSEVKYAAHPEWREAKIIDDPNFFSLKGREYDFENARINTGLSNDVVIDIPSATRRSSRARVTIRSIAHNIRENVMRAINRALGRMRPESDFYAELVAELKQFNISPSAIQLEKDDCIICYNPATPHLPGVPGPLSDWPATPSPLPHESANLLPVQLRKHDC